MTPVAISRTYIIYGITIIYTITIIGDTVILCSKSVNVIIGTVPIQSIIRMTINRIVAYFTVSINTRKKNPITTVINNQVFNNITVVTIISRNTPRRVV